MWEMHPLHLLSIPTSLESVSNLIHLGTGPVVDAIAMCGIANSVSISFMTSSETSRILSSSCLIAAVVSSAIAAATFTVLLQPPLEPERARGVVGVRCFVFSADTALTIASHARFLYRVPTTFILSYHFDRSRFGV